MERSNTEIRELLHKLAAGKTTDQEKEWLYQLAAEDPFLQEAIQGYESMQQTQAGNLDDLRRELKSLTQSKSNKRTKIPFWQIAASFTLLAGTAGLMLLGSLQEQKLDNQGSGMTFKASPSKTEQASTPEDDLALSSDHPEESVGDLKQEEEIEEAVEKDDDVEKTAPGVSAETGIAATDLEEDAHQAESAVAGDLAANAPSIIAGQVSDEAGYPLIGAEIRSLQDDSTLQTDQQGRFNISQSDIVNGIEISSQGYKTKQIVPVTPDNLTSIILEEDTQQLQEIAARQMERPEAPPPTAARQALQNQEASRPEPVIGWQKYYAYIDQNLHTPQAARESQISGTVEVSFTINPEGQAIDIQIEKSLGYGWDEEAIRIIENGPKWKLPSDGGIRQKISILFN